MILKISISQYKRLKNLIGVTYPINVKGCKLATKLAHLINARPQRK